MCGIAGIVGGVTDASVNVAGMLRAQGHRGPDGSGMVSFEGGAVGAVRLALVDLSDRGQQPIWSADRRVAIAFNGEMYNYREERSRLEARGHQFRSSTDTEVVLHLYLEHGPDFVHRIRGMFAIAILDWRETTPAGRPTLVLARDHFGIKPLYVAQPKGSRGPLVFSSEVRSLLASGLVSKRIDRQGLTDYLALGFVLQPRTILAGVEMLERGSLLKMTPEGDIERRIYWSIPQFCPVRETFEQSAERLRAVLEESIALHAMADAPVGAFLSGGVDSAGVVALMSRKNPKLRTYTIRLTEFPQADESAQAAAFARSLGCESTLVEVGGPEIADLVAHFAADIDQPSVDGFNTWLVSRAAAKDVKGVLSGLGGDEWFAGYAATRKLARYGSGWGKMYPLAGWLAASIRRNTPRSYVGRRLEGLALKARPVTAWIDCRQVFGYELAAELVNHGTAKHEQYADFERILDAISPEWQKESPVGLSCLLDVDVYMRCQLLRDSDVTSMASSLELRVPFVDMRVAEFSRSCADTFKLRTDGGDGLEYGSSGAKRVLIHALRDLLPADIASRPKRGFTIPYKHWLRQNLIGIVEETCSRRTISNRGLVDPDLATSLAHDDSARRWSAWPLAWSLMILELWCRSVLDENVTREQLPAFSSMVSAGSQKEFPMPMADQFYESLPPGAVVNKRQSSLSQAPTRRQVMAIFLDNAPRAWGSREELHLRFCRELIARGVSPVFVFSDTPSEEVKRRFQYAGAQVAPAINHESGIFNSYRQLGKVIKYHSVTAMHIAFFNYFSLIPWMARLQGVRQIVHHERNSGTLRATSWKKWLLLLRTRITTRPITRVVAISEYIKQQLMECGIPETKIMVAYNGIDVRRFSPDPTARARLVAQFSVQPTELILATVTYLRAFKNPQVIVEALAELQRRGVAARLFVAGDGEMQADLEALSQRLGISDRIHWLGDVADPVPLLQGCDIYVMASMGEAFGLALVEAMACGAPVIASRSGAFPEIVEDGRSGLLVPPLDSVALADAIEKLAKDADLRRRVALNGVERVGRYFTMEASIAQMMQVYESVWRCL